MSKSLLILCLILLLSSIALGQQFDQVNLKMFAENISRTKTNISETCENAVALDTMACVEDVQAKYFDSAEKMIKQKFEAAEKMDMDTFIYLDKQIYHQSCCGGWYGMDCIIVATKVI